MRRPAAFVATAYILISLLMCACTSIERDRTVDLTPQFEGLDGCMVLWSSRDDTTVRYRPDRCAERLSPCSTFKIPNAIIALESGFAPDADTPVPWDGVVRDRASLNADHTLRSAIHDSVVWYFQQVAAHAGVAREQAFLDAIPYGNCDLSGGLTRFWLESSLRISADEQVQFLRKLRSGNLPATPRSMAIVKDCLIVDDEFAAPLRRAGASFVLHGKTGSGGGPNLLPDGSPRDQSQDIGWFVGWLEEGDDVTVFAVNVRGPGAFGPTARRIAIRILAERAGNS